MTQIYKESEIHAVFLGDKTLKKLHTCSMSPCQPVNERCVFFVSCFRQILFVFLNLGLKESQIPGEKQNTCRQRVDRDSWNTCAKFQAIIISQKRRKHLGFRAENVYSNLRSCTVSTLFQYGINFQR